LRPWLGPAELALRFLAGRDDRCGASPPFGNSPVDALVQLLLEHAVEGLLVEGSGGPVRGRRRSRRGGRWCRLSRSADLLRGLRGRPGLGGSSFGGAYRIGLHGWLTARPGRRRGAGRRGGGRSRRGRLGGGGSS